MSIWEDKNSLAGQFWANGRLDDCPIYDMHGHMGEQCSIYFKLADPADSVAHMRRIGVKRLAFCYTTALKDPHYRNAMMYDICVKYPDLLRMYAAINPHYPENIKEDLALYDSWSPYTIGLKLLPDYHKTAISDKRYAYALAFANERKLPVLFHTWGGSPLNGYEQLRIVAERYPDMIMFVGHSLHSDWENAVKLVKEAPGKVYLELTAIPGEHGIIEYLTAGVGSERLLFGTDMPWFDEYQVAGGILSAKISDDEKRNIFYRNVEALLGKDW